MNRKMKSLVVLALGLALTGAVLVGCGESGQPLEDTQQGIPTSISEETRQDAVTEVEEKEVPEQPAQSAGEETEAAQEPAQTAGGYEDNFAVDSEAAKAFAQKVQEAAAQKDLDALAELTAFPVYVGLPDAGVVETKEDFLGLGADAVFTDELLASIKMADIDDFQPSMAGFQVSDGSMASVNFGVVDGVLAINGINY